MKSLFDQTALSGINLKNRLIRSATYDKLADEHGHMTKELFEVYEKLAPKTSCVFNRYNNSDAKLGTNKGII